jgi:hypothetical protein
MSERLDAYLDAQGEPIEALRNRSQPNRPWPETDNPMLEYLMRRSAEISDTDSVREAIVWLTVHAWFEGALEARAEMLRSITD